MRPTAMLAALLIALSAAALAPGQGGPGDEDAAGGVPGPAPAAGASSGGGNGSFGEIFFISRSFDPSTGEQPVEWLGSGIIWVILALSVVSLGLMGQLGLANRRVNILPPDVVAEVKRQLSAGRYREVMEKAGGDPSFFGALLRGALAEANQGYGAVIRALEQTSAEQTTIRLRRIEYLNMLAQVSPMIGLFGTVYGMILAFQAIVAAGGNADPVMLAGGIGTALVTTFWGLIVAIPALAAYAVIRNRADELTTEATRVAEELLRQFRPKSKPRPGAAASTSP